MKSLKKSCLAYQLGVRPAIQRISMVNVKVPVIVDALNRVLSTGKVAKTSEGVSVDAVGCPEVDALTFYMMNHAVSVIRSNHHPLQELGDALEVLEAYHNALIPMATRMFLYLLVICTRESRHTKDDKHGPVLGLLRQQHGDAIADFHWSLRGLSSSSAVEKLQNSPPDASLGSYTQFLYDVFKQGKYNNSYGGKAWAAVAKVLMDYVHGILSAEMMLDTAFTLAHNNGPIFNKGVLFDHYTSELIKILDVQRSGQVPKMVGNGETSFKSNGDLKKLWTLCEVHAKNDFNGYVDWYLVESLGSIHKYHNEKSSQDQKHGAPKTSIFHKANIPKKAKPVEDDGSTIEVFSGFKLNKAEVKR